MEEAGVIEASTSEWGALLDILLKRMRPNDSALIADD
jgi:hypothetical protein